MVAGSSECFPRRNGARPRKDRRRPSGSPGEVGAGGARIWSRAWLGDANEEKLRRGLGAASEPARSSVHGAWCAAEGGGWCSRPKKRRMVVAAVATGAATGGAGEAVARTAAGTKDEGGEAGDEGRAARRRQCWARGGGEGRWRWIRRSEE